MKVSALIALLQTMPADADVLIEWGGTLNEGESGVESVRKEELTDHEGKYFEVFIEY